LQGVARAAFPTAVGVETFGWSYAATIALSVLRPGVLVPSSSAGEGARGGRVVGARVHELWENAIGAVDETSDWRDTCWKFCCSGCAVDEFCLLAHDEGG